ncbi:hypothetical protein AVEN_151806-1, partial [Araneus ventricosus]
MDVIEGEPPICGTEFEGCVVLAVGAAAAGQAVTPGEVLEQLLLLFLGGGCGGRRGRSVVAQLLRAGPKGGSGQRHGAHYGAVPLKSLNLVLPLDGGI